jgi:hypothetical protein
MAKPNSGGGGGYTVLVGKSGLKKRGKNEEGGN